MSQSDIIDHFLGNGNEWEQSMFLRESFGSNKSILRMSDITERRKEGQRILYRLKTAVFSELSEARGL